MTETYLIKVKKLKPVWERLGFSSEKSMLQNQSKYGRI
jgi:hypothetical protein